MPEVRFAGFRGEWEENPIGDIVTEIIRPFKMSNNDTYELVTVKRRNGGVVSRGLFKGSEVLVKTQFLICEGDFLISKRQIVHGASATVPKTLDGSIVSNEYLVLNGTDKLNIKFLSLISELPLMYNHYYLSSYGVDKEKLVFNVNDWKKRKVKIPSIQEQNQIVLFVHSLKEIIQRSEQELDLLKQTKQGFLQKMFPKEGESVPEVRFPGFSGEWGLLTLGDITNKFEYGLNASATNYDGKNRYIRITDIDDHSRNLINNNLTSPNTDLSLSQSYLLNQGDILIARTGASVGKSYIYDSSDGIAYFAGFLIRMRLLNNYHPYFIFQNTLTEKYRTYINITSQRSGQPGVNAKEYANFSLRIPILEEQTQIGNFFKKLDDTIALHQKELDMLKETKKAFLQKMFV